MEQNGKKEEQREMSHAKQDLQFIPLSVSSNHCFFFAVFIMIYQAMNQTSGICNSLLTSQKQSIHVRTTKTQ